MSSATRAVLLSTCLALAVPAVVVSTTQVHGQQFAQTQQQGAEIDQATIVAFAEASLEVEAIGQAWSPRIVEAESEEEAQTLRAEAAEEMTEAVEQAGLTVQLYNQIAQAAQ